MSNSIFYGKSWVKKMLASAHANDLSRAEIEQRTTQLVSQSSDVELGRVIMLLLDEACRTNSVPS